MKNFVISQTPYRLSLLGGGSDFPEYFRTYGTGAVLTMSLGHCVRVIVKRRIDRSYKVTYTTSEEPVYRASDIGHDLIRESLMYMQNVVAPELRKAGLEIVTLGDVPAGTGLGSSSAVTVGVLAALYAIAEIPISQMQLASAANYIERDIVGRPIGWQDAYGCALGGVRIIRFGSDDHIRTIALLPADYEPLLSHLLLFYTGATRNACSVLYDVKWRVDQNRQVLTELVGLAEQGYNALGSGNHNQIGILLKQAWELKKQTSKGITTPLIDDAYCGALEAGAVGGKVTGAGGGGCIVLYAPPNCHKAIRDTNGMIEIPVTVDTGGVRIIYES